MDSENGTSRNNGIIAPHMNEERAAELVTKTFWTPEQHKFFVERVDEYVMHVRTCAVNNQLLLLFFNQEKFTHG